MLASHPSSSPPPPPPRDHAPPHPAAAAVPRLTLLALLLLLASAMLDGARGLGSMATIAASYDGKGGALICGVVQAGTSQQQGIQCWNSWDGSVSRVSPLHLPFAGLSGGRGFFCGLRQDTFRLLCWNHTDLRSPKRLEDAAFTDIVAGDSHVCALSSSGTMNCWRGNSSNSIGAAAATAQGQEISNTTSNFSRLASGSDFVCGLRSGDSMAVCWGNPVVLNPPNVSFQSLQAGSSHACGLTYTFNVQCWGDNSHNQLAAPLGKQFLSLALGHRHSCGIEAFSRNVFCWGGSSSISTPDDDSASLGQPPSSLTFAAITAGDSFTCGSLFGNMSVFCWASSSSSTHALFLPLPPIIPSPCTTLPCADGSFQISQNGLCSASDAHVCLHCRIGCQGVSTQTQSCSAQQDIACTNQALGAPYGAPWLPPSSGSPPSPAAPTSVVVESKRSSKGSLILIAFGACGSAFGFISVVWCAWTKLVRRRHGGGGNIVGGGRVQSSLMASMTSSKSTMRRQRSSTSTGVYRGNREGKAQAFSIAEMEAATMGFAEEKRIGAGSFGVVYRGTLSDGRAVAIKRGDKEAATSMITTMMQVDSHNDRRLKEKESAFQSELEFLSRLHHKHLVSLVGYCDEEDERMLVYDYMPNGTLHDHLHGHRLRGGGGGVASPPLPWQMRIKIALEAARGVEYLHKYALPPIIHRDIKSSNILLDAQWNARVSDFGLSTHGPIEKSHLSLMAAGTLGYMDPEYYRHQHLTIKSDVYSFGVVLLELLTGERAIHKQSHGPVNIVDFSVPHITAGDLASLLDRRASPPSDRELAALEMIAQLAIKCVKLEFKERPTMSEIVGVLEEAMAGVKTGSGVSEVEAAATAAAAAEEYPSEAPSEAMMAMGSSDTFPALVVGGHHEEDMDEYADEESEEDCGAAGEEEGEGVVSPTAMSVIVSPAAPEAEDV